MTTRQSYFVQPGNIKNLTIESSELPDPGPGQVQVAIRAIGLNFADIFAIWGLYKAAPKTRFVPGLEFAGEVAAVGEGVTQWKPGDRVMGGSKFGAYTTRINVGQGYLLPIPAGWSYEEGAAMLVQALTAQYALVNLGRVQAGQTVLIHSGAGGVGLLANRIAKKHGAITIGTIGSPAKKDLCLAEGYDRVIVRRPGKAFGAQLDEALEGRPLHLVLETIGGQILMEGFKRLAPQGMMVVYSTAGFATPTDKPNIFHLFRKYFTRPRIDPMRLTNQNRGIVGFNLIYLFENADYLHEVYREVDDLHLPPPRVGHTFPFERLPDAVRLLLSGQTTGKVVVTVP